MVGSIRVILSCSECESLFGYYLNRQVRLLIPVFILDILKANSIKQPLLLRLIGMLYHLPNTAACHSSVWRGIFVIRRLNEGLEKASPLDSLLAPYRI
jgi:hypothetical protein